MPLDEIEAYFRTYDKRAFRVFACQGREPREDDMASFEMAVGLRLPAPFRGFTMSGLGGLYMEVREELWPRPKPLELGPSWSFHYGIKVFGLGDGIPKWLDLRVRKNRFHKRTGRDDLVPFLQVVGAADCFCFQTDETISKWHHESGSLQSIELGFRELLMREIRHLEQRLARKRAEARP